VSHDDDDEQFTDKACTGVEIANNAISDLRSVTKASMTSFKNEIDGSEQTVCYDINTDFVNIDSQSADIDIIDKKEIAKPSSGKQICHSQNNQPAHLSVTEKQSIYTTTGYEKAQLVDQFDIDKQSRSTSTGYEQAERVEQCDIDKQSRSTGNKQAERVVQFDIVKVVEGSTDIGISKDVISNATVSCSHSRASHRMRTRRKTKLRKRTHFTHIAAKCQSPWKQAEKKTGKHGVLISPDQSSISVQGKRTLSQAVQVIKCCCFVNLCILIFVLCVSGINYGN